MSLAPIDLPLLVVANRSVSVVVEDGAKQVGATSIRILVANATAAIAEKGQFVLAVSGGSIPPLLVLGEIVSLANGSSSDIQLNKWKFLFADERCVPLDHPDSNYRLWKTEIFDKIDSFDIAANVLTIGEVDNAEQCALNYYSRLQHFLGLPSPVTLADSVIDMSILGMGPDGHTASLFPGHALVVAGADADAESAISIGGESVTDEEAALQVIAYIEDSPKPPSCRVTFTLRALNKSKSVLFIVTGSAKASAIASIFEVREDEGEDSSALVLINTPSAAYPASLIRTDENPVMWVLDKAAGESLYMI